MKRTWHKTAALAAGAMLIAVWLHLPANAADPDPPFLEKQPPGIAVSNTLGIRQAPDGTVWLTDADYGQVIKWDPACTPQPDDNCAEYFGSKGDADGQFDRPFTIAFYDPNDSPATYLVFITDETLNRVTILDQDGNFVDLLDSSATPQGSFDGPSGVTADDVGNIYVSDTDHDSVHVFDSEGNYLTTWPAWGEGDAYLDGPRGIYFEADSDGDGPDEDFIYVVGRGIYYILLYEVFPNGALNQYWVFADDPSNPGDITKSGDFVYMADTYNLGSIHRKDVTEDTTGEEYGSPFEFLYPSGVEVVDGLLLVGDASNIFKRYADIATAPFSPTLDSYVGNRGSQPGDEFDHSNGIAVHEGRRYIVDGYNRRVQIFDADGSFVAEWIHPWDSPGLGGDLDGQDGPHGIAIDAAGGVYVADPDANVMIYFPPNYDGGVVGPVVWEETLFETTVDTPYDIAVDSTGRVFVTDIYDELVHVYQKTVDVPTLPAHFTYLGNWSTGVETLPAGIALDEARGVIYVSDISNQRVLVYTFPAVLPPTFLGSILSTGSGDGQVQQPDDVAVDAEGQLWVSDSSNHRVQVFEVTFGPLTATFLNAVGSRGGDEGQLYYPRGIFHDAFDGLYVADGLNHRYQVFGDPDVDNDGVLNDADNCPTDANAGQLDTDSDDLGDACDGDDDGDEVLDGGDNCPVDANPGQENNDSDANGGDACDPDDDNDGVIDQADNCQFISNPGQQNNENDSQGDACDVDDDNDEAPDVTDNCPSVFNPAQTDTDNDGIGDACEAVPTATPTSQPTSTRTPIPTATPTLGASFNPPTAVATGTPLPTSTPPATATVAATQTAIATVAGSTSTPAGGSPGTGQAGVPNTGAPAQLATGTPAPSATAVSTTAPGVTPTPTPTPTGPGVTPTPPGPTPIPENRPELFNEVLDARDISTNMDAIAANAILSAILLLLLIDASIFNSTIKENEHQIMGFFGGVIAPLKSFGNTWTGAGGQSFLARFGKPLLVLGLSAFVYSLLEPGFSFDTSALVLFLSLLVGIGIATYVYEGAQVFISERIFQMNSAIRFYPIAIVIALVSVGLSKLTGLHPGLVYGFVAGAALFAHREPDEREAGMIIFFPMAAMLLTGIVAWLLLAPLRDLSEDGNIVALILEGAALTLFIGGIQGLLFALIPLSFIDGEKVWRWSKLAWASIAFPVGFLFFHVVVNQDGSLASAIDENGVTVLIIVAAFSWTLTIGTWLLFKARSAAP